MELLLGLYRPSRSHLRLEATLNGIPCTHFPISRMVQSMIIRHDLNTLYPTEWSIHTVSRITPRKRTLAKAARPLAVKPKTPKDCTAAWTTPPEKRSGEH